MICASNDKEPSQVLPEEMCQLSSETYHQLRRSFPVLDQDLNCLPYPVTPSESSDDQQIEQSSSGSLSLLFIFLLRKCAGLAILGPTLDSRVRWGCWDRV